MSALLTERERSAAEEAQDLAAVLEDTGIKTDRLDEAWQRAVQRLMHEAWTLGRRRGVQRGKEIAVESIQSLLYDLKLPPEQE